MSEAEKGNSLSSFSVPTVFDDAQGQTGASDTSIQYSADPSPNEGAPCPLFLEDGGGSGAGTSAAADAVEVGFACVPIDHAKIAPCATPNVAVAGDSEFAYAQLPLQMQKSRRWLLWKSLPADNAAARAIKKPFYVSGAARGKTDTPEDRARLATFSDAIQALSTGSYSGLGFALGEDDSGLFWQGVDVDKISEQQLTAALEGFPSYTEVSPSGNGCHCIGLGRFFKSLGANNSGVEAYAAARFFTVTGRGNKKELVCVAGFVAAEIAPAHSRGSVAQFDSMSHTTLSPIEVTHLRSALNHLSSDEYELWIKIGMYLKELGPTGLGLWLDWSQLSPKYSASTATAKWSTFRPIDASYKGVFTVAQAAGWLNPMSNSARDASQKSGDDSGFYALAAPTLRTEAMYGILKEIADAGSENSEAVPAALAVNTLARFCASIGSQPFVQLGDEQRSLRPFTLVIGPTGRGRKGTSAVLPAKLFERAEAILEASGQIQVRLRTESAVTSGEGLIFMVRDKTLEDPGVLDKRVLLEISEFSGALAQTKRESSVLTAVLRDAFDGRKLTLPNKNSPCTSTDSHFVVVGHITREEFTNLIRPNEINNGFVNRFMMVYSARVKRVYEPKPTPAERIEFLAARLAQAISTARKSTSFEVPRSPAASRRWAEIADELDARMRDPTVSKLMARETVYVLILAASICLINQESVVEPVHLDAALAWIDYWEETANFCFASAAAVDEMHLMKQVMHEIVAAVESLGGNQVTHSAMAKCVSNDGRKKGRSADVINRAVAHLQTEAPPRIRVGRAPGKGRTATVYSRAETT